MRNVARLIRLEIGCRYGGKGGENPIRCFRPEVHDYSEAFGDNC